MNPVYAPIFVGVIQFIGTIIFLAWKKGKDDEKLELLREAHNEAVEEIENLKDVNMALSNEVANIRGYLRGGSGAPINGGSH